MDFFQSGIYMQTREAKFTHITCVDLHLRGDDSAKNHQIFLNYQIAPQVVCGWEMIFQNSQMGLSRTYPYWKPKKWFGKPIYYLEYTKGSLRPISLNCQFFRNSRIMPRFVENAFSWLDNGCTQPILMEMVMIWFFMDWIV